ncbi:hypothetical protein PybrP1_002642, partial [[Pythium] brassicae (nom. inval.)]
EAGDDCASPLTLKANLHAQSPPSRWSLAFFSGCARLAQLCSQRPLRLADLWTLRDEDTSAFCAAQLKAALTTSRSLVLAALRTQRRLLLASGALSLSAVACELAGPVAVYMVVHAAATGGMEHVLSKGAVWTLMLLASRFLRSYTLAWAELLLRVADVRVAGALQVLLMESVLDKKRLQQRQPTPALSGSANLFTTDVANVASAFRVIHRLWMMPLELLGLFVVFRWIAGHVISGILLVSFVVYATIQLVTWSEASLFRQWLAITDERFGILERTFQHIVAIKLNVWEDWVLDQILAVRRAEQRVLQRHILVRTLRYTLTWIAPVVNLIATGVLLVNTTNRAFDSPAFTFSAVTIFHSINDTFATAMAVVEVFFQFRVSLLRIHATLQLSHMRERDSSQQSPGAARDASGQAHSLGATSADAISVVSASFANPQQAAAPDADALLVNLNLRVRRGEFVVVHGKVGCGNLRLSDAVLRDPLVVQIQAAPGARSSPTAASSSYLVNHAPCAYRRKGWATVMKEYISYSQSFSVLCVVVFLHYITQVLSTTSIYCFSRWIASIGQSDESADALAHTIALFQRYMWVVAASCASFLDWFWLVWWVVMVLNVAVTVGILSAFWRDGIRSNKPSGEIYLMFRETYSPLFNFVTEAMSGKRVIASFGPEQTLRVARTFGDKVDESSRILLGMWYFETWVGLRSLVMESLLSSALLVVLIAFGHEPSESAEPATIGLLLFLLLNIREDLKSAFANWNMLEKDLACVERVLEFIDVAPEAASSALAPPIDPFWPRTGAITFQTVYFQYDSATTSAHHYQNHDDESTRHSEGGGG